jgi:predicted alpha/beta superfamily hydrolase
VAKTATNGGKPKLAAKRAPVALPYSTQFDMASKISGRTYRIFVFRPPVEPPEGGYPVVYFTDGNFAFPIAMAMGSAFSLFVQSPVLVVGVGYPGDALLDHAARMRDLTPPTPPSAVELEPGIPEPTAETFGGAEDFRRFLTEELRARIAAEYPASATDQTLSGYSLGGLFVLNVLFAHPTDFRSYAACSPSIWWNRRAVLRRERAFTKTVEAKDVAPRVLITIGAGEQTPPATATPQIRKLIRGARMVDNARELGERLAALKGGPGYVARFQCFEREDHLSATAAAVSRTLAFALRP